MTGTDGEVIYTRDLSSGRVHKRVRVGDRLQTFEGDNLDTAGRYEVIATTDETEPDALCERCFPPEAA